jgi:hypothetical protein
MRRVAATAALLLALLLVGAYGAAGDVATLKARAVHDPVAAMRGLIARRLGGKYADQVSSLSSLAVPARP